jgi:ParB-like chromosome segregation protein Spo0J
MQPRASPKSSFTRSPPLMEGEEFDALAADIKKTDILHEEIVLYEDKILDGRNRYRACLAAGWTLERIAEHCYRFEALGYKMSPLTFVLSKNLHRRHLSPEDKRRIIAELIKAQPQKSNLQIAKTVKVSPTTVGTVRTKMEAAGDVSKLETRKDTKGREQPAKKADRKQPAPKPVKHDARVISPELGEQVGRLAYRLIQLDRELARELADLILQRGVVERLWADLDTGIAIDIEERAS